MGKMRIFWSKCTIVNLNKAGSKNSKLLGLFWEGKGVRKMDGQTWGTGRNKRNYSGIIQNIRF